MLKNSVHLIMLLVITFSFSGCGSMFTGTTSMFAISSEPEKAKVYVNGMYIGQTPTATSLKKDKDYTIVLKKEGYEDASAVVTRSFNAVAILNLLSPICWIIDIVTGGVWKFDREGVTVEMEQKAKTAIYPRAIPTEKMAIKTLGDGKTAIYAK